MDEEADSRHRLDEDRAALSAAWDALIEQLQKARDIIDSPEAFAALRAGLPFMVEADLVKLVIVDPPSHGRDRSDPGGAVSEYLARHKIRVEIDVLSKSLPRVSDVILRHATDADCDLIVMGAYGHSRFREAMLGGATRHMLEQADRPLLMAHS